MWKYLEMFAALVVNIYRKVLCEKSQSFYVKLALKKFMDKLKCSFIFLLEELFDFMEEICCSCNLKHFSQYFSYYCLQGRFDYFAFLKTIWHSVISSKTSFKLISQCKEVVDLKDHSIFVSSASELSGVIRKMSLNNLNKLKVCTHMYKSILETIFHLIHRLVVVKS